MWVYLIFIRADLGVFIFFILSGFLITYLLTGEYAASGTINLRNFYLRRVLRIFPAFYTYLLVLGVLAILGIIPVALSHFVDAGLFVWNYKHFWDPTNGPGIWYLGHFWTLSLEEQFYLLWPLTLLFLNIRRAAWVALALIILMPIVRLVTYFEFPESRGQLMMMLHTGADSLMFGCLLALVIRHDRTNALLDRLKKPLWPVAATLFACIVSPLAAACLPGHVEGGYSNTLGRSLTGISVTFVIAWLLKFPDCAAGRFLNSRLMVHIGVLSYSLYLWQQLFLTPFKQRKLGTGELPLNFRAACMWPPLLSYHVTVEKLFLGLKEKFAFSR